MARSTLPKRKAKERKAEGQQEQDMELAAFLARDLM